MKKKVGEKKKSRHKIIFDEYIQSFKSLPRIYPRLLLPLATDLIFVILFVFSQTIYNAKVMQILNKLNMSLALNVQGLFESFASRVPIGEIMRTFPDIKTAIIQFTGWALIFSLITIILYNIFQAFSWKFCYSITEKEIGYKLFFYRFFMTNLFWGLIIIVLNTFDIIYTFFMVLMTRDLPVVSQYLKTAIIVLIVYFVFISYCLIPVKGTWKRIKESFRLGIKEIVFLGGSFIAIIATLIILNSLVGLLEFGKLRVVLEVLIILPLISLMRIFFIRICSKV